MKMGDGSCKGMMIFTMKRSSIWGPCAGDSTWNLKDVQANGISPESGFRPIAQDQVPFRQRTKRMPAATDACGPAGFAAICAVLFSSPSRPLP